MTEVPTFVSGEPGYTKKLNQLGAVVRELQQAIAELSVKDLSDLTVVELRALAKDRGIDLGDATKKDVIIAAIEAAEK